VHDIAVTHWIDHHPELATALATIALAAVTLMVARQTRAAAETAVRPLLADVAPMGEGHIVYQHPQLYVGKENYAVTELADPHTATVMQPKTLIPIELRSFPLRNIGNGAAWVQKVYLKSSSGRCIGWSSPTVIGAGDVGRLLTAEFPPATWQPPDAWEPGMSFPFSPGYDIVVDYTDIHQRQEQTTIVEVRPGYMGGPAAVTVRPHDRRLTFRRGREGDPLATAS
jgi:hypothetical protein